jgi:hypothetical protein
MGSDSTEDNNSACLLDIRNLGGKYLGNLGDHFLDKKLIFHSLSSLHDIVKVSINLTGLRMILTYRTTAASMTRFLSSFTFFTISADSTIVSSLIGKSRLTRISFDSKSNYSESLLVALKQEEDITD